MMAGPGAEPAPTPRGLSSTPPSVAAAAAPKSPNQRPTKSKRGPGAGKKGGDGKQFSCHYCRQKRGDIVACPKHVEGHRWCGSCIRNHFKMDIEEIRANPTKLWPDGCAPLLNRPSLPSIACRHPATA